LVGLILVAVGRYCGLDRYFNKADDVGAQAVVVAMLYVSLRMAKRAGDFLVDRAPIGLARQVQSIIESVGGVLEVQRLRTRQSGNEIFVDAEIVVDGACTLAEADGIATTVEYAIAAQLPNADVMLHVEPGRQDAPSVADIVRTLAGDMKLPVHGIRVRDVHGQVHLSLHVEMPPEAALAEVHEQLSRLESAIRTEVPNVVEIDTHPEPLGRAPGQS